MKRGTKSPKLRYARLFSNESECLRFLFNLQYGGMKRCPSANCGLVARFYRVAKRKCYECGHCGHQLYPMTGTVMAKSQTSLTTWFAVLWEMISSPNGVSHEAVARNYGISYGTAHRMCMKIRKSMSGLLAKKLYGIVEMDESYFGGRKDLVPGSEYKRGIGNKNKVVGMCQRGKHLRLFHVRSLDARTMRPLIKKMIEKGSVIHHDGNSTYGDLEKAGYHPRRVWKKTDKTFSGINNNRIESSWMRAKHRKIIGVHHGVTGQYLQHYLDEFCYQQRDRGQWVRKNIALAIIQVVLGRVIPPRRSRVREFVREIGPLRQTTPSARQSRRRRNRKSDR